MTPPATPPPMAFAFDPVSSDDAEVLSGAAAVDEDAAEAEVIMGASLALVVAADESAELNVVGLNDPAVDSVLSGEE